MVHLAFLWTTAAPLSDPCRCVCGRRRPAEWRSVCPILGHQRPRDHSDPWAASCHGDDFIPNEVETNPLLWGTVEVERRHCLPYVRPELMPSVSLGDDVFTQDTPRCIRRRGPELHRKRARLSCLHVLNTIWQMRCFQDKHTSCSPLAPSTIRPCPILRTTDHEQPKNQYGRTSKMLVG